MLGFLPIGPRKGTRKARARLGPQVIAGVRHPAEMVTLLAALIGRRCREVSFDAATTEWIFVFGDALVLQTTSPWRIMKSGEVMLRGGGEGQIEVHPDPLEMAALASNLLSSPVETARASDVTGDLALTFQHGSLLEVFNASKQYEGWILNAPKGYVVAQGGGRVIEHERSDV